MYIITMGDLPESLQGKGVAMCGSGGGWDHVGVSGEGGTMWGFGGNSCVGLGDGGAMWGFGGRVGSCVGLGEGGAMWGFGGRVGSV